MAPRLRRHYFAAAMLRARYRCLPARHACRYMLLPDMAVAPAVRVERH